LLAESWLIPVGHCTSACLKTKHKQGDKDRLPSHSGAKPIICLTGFFLSRTILGFNLLDGRTGKPEISPIEPNCVA